MKRKYLLLLPAAAIAGVVFAQGPLTPPGAPAPVMKTLDQIEPRTPITSLPFTISQSGSYYLTRNLQFTAGTGSAITISAHDVTLDLMGFTLSSTGPVSDAAISVPGNSKGLTIINGNIAGTTTVTISGTSPNRVWQISPGGFRHAITAFSADGCRLANLHIRGCREEGIIAGERALVERIRAEHNGGNGIEISDHGQVSQCFVSLSGNYGIYAARGTVTGTTVVDNKNSGMQVSYGIVSTCSARDNGGAGLSAFVGVVSFSTATGSGSGGGSVVYSEINASGATRTGNNPAP